MFTYLYTNYKIYNARKVLSRAHTFQDFTRQMENVALQLQDYANTLPASYSVREEIYKLGHSMVTSFEITDDPISKIVYLTFCTTQAEAILEDRRIKEFPEAITFLGTLINFFKDILNEILPESFQIQSKPQKVLINYIDSLNKISKTLEEGQLPEHLDSMAKERIKQENNNTIRLR